MRHRRPVHLRRGAIAAAIALAVALPFNALAAEPTPDPPEPYLMGTVSAGIAAVKPAATARVARA